MSQLTIKISAKGEAMIANLQKEIFNRRRKKVTASQVVETLVESGAKSQSDKRYAASWKNLVKDIEKTAKISEIHGNKPANISADEWALILSHRTRKGIGVHKVSTKTLTKKSKAKKAVVKKTSTKPAVKRITVKKGVIKNEGAKAAPSKRAAKAKVKATKVKTALRKVASAQARKTTSSSNSVSKRIAKDVAGRSAGRLKKSRAKTVKA